jgi:hypothetical protein
LLRALIILSARARSIVLDPPPFAMPFFSWPPPWRIILLTSDYVAIAATLSPPRPCNRLATCSIAARFIHCMRVPVAQDVYGDGVRGPGKQRKSIRQVDLQAVVFTLVILPPVAAHARAGRRISCGSADSLVAVVWLPRWDCLLRHACRRRGCDQTSMRVGNSLFGCRPGKSLIPIARR